MLNVEPGREDEFEYWRETYALNAEIMRAIDSPRLEDDPLRDAIEPPLFLRRTSRPIIGPIATRAGRALRLAGERLEDWARA